MATNDEIKWELYDPLGRNYYWLKVVEPIIPFDKNLTGKADTHAKKTRARELAQMALEKAKSDCIGYDISAICVTREIGLTNRGYMKTKNVYFKVENLKIIDKKANKKSSIE